MPLNKLARPMGNTQNYCCCMIELLINIKENEEKTEAHSHLTISLGDKKKKDFKRYNTILVFTENTSFFFNGYFCADYLKE